jgi:NADH-quinone oxidoreductase subunit G
MEKPKETMAKVMGGREPKLLFDIHTVSEVNKPGVDLSLISGPATSEVFDSNGKALNPHKP